MQIRKAILGAMMLCGSSIAHAAIYEASFENNIGSQTVTNPITAADVLVMSGMLTSGAGAVTNSTSFTAGAGVVGISLDAVWRSGSAGDTLRLIGVNIDLIDNANTVVASDSFIGVLGGFAHSELDFGALTPGVDYTLRLTGTNVDVGQYVVDASFAAVPVPGAAILMMTALGGLGALRLRRREAEAA